jgi:hypothetical protein
MCQFLEVDSEKCFGSDQAALMGSQEMERECERRKAKREATDEVETG